MTAEIGAFLLALGLVSALAQGALGVFARDRAPYAQAAAACAQVGSVAFAAAFVLLILLFARSDFSVAAVAANSHTAKPLLYKIAAAWGHHEGSMLLWCLVSALAGLLLAVFRGGLPHALWSAAVGVQGFVTAGAALYTLALSNPFARLPLAPVEGEGLNPLLQDPALAAHPPLLYLGYVGLSAPFSLTVAALITGQFDKHLAGAIRPWALAAWTALTIGIALGSYWAYYELGWGGAWAWDPVENASFLPWLMGAALLHSAIVTARRGTLLGWTLLLAIAGFGFSLLGTFLVRSGVLSSVHAFAVDPARGVAVLALFVVAIGTALGLYAWRAPQMPTPAGFTLVSREGALTFNNFVLAVSAGVVLLGTLYPLLAEAVTGRPLSVGAPFFNLAFGPMAGVLLAAAPIGTLLAWRKGDLAGALKALWWAAAAGLAVAAIGLALRAGAAPALGLGLGAFMLLGAGAYIWRRAGSGAGRWRRLVLLPMAVWAVALAHAGVGALTIGAVAQTALRIEHTGAMAVGDVQRFAGRNVTLQMVEPVPGANYDALRARFVVEREGRTRILRPERRTFISSSSATTEVAIASEWLGDLYIALGEPTLSEDGVARFGVRLYFNPFVSWMFAGAGMIALGGLLALAALAVRARAAARAPLGGTVPATAPALTPAE